MTPTSSDSDGIYAENLKRESVTVFEGYGKLLNSTTVEVNGVQLKAAHILIAVGGYPKVPDVPGAQLGITSNGFFALKEQPKSVAIVGTGYIGVELAGIFHALGSEVSLYSKYDTVLPHFDTLLRTELCRTLPSKAWSSSRTPKSNASIAWRAANSR